ncbi:MAG: Gfo/Idh/MocA family protein [Spirochaetota bacterium]
MAPIKLAVVGPGLIWDNAHRDVLLSMPEHFQVVAFLARRETTLSKAHRQVPDARLFTNYEDLLASPEVDAVVLLTPIPVNGPMTVQALEAGKQVFVEKPFAVSSREGQRVQEAARRSGVPVYVLEQAPYAPLWDRVGERIEAGDIGIPATYEKIRHVYLDPEEDQTSGYGGTDWRIETTFPIGNLFDGGVHDLAVHAKLFGSPSKLRAWGRSYREGFGEFDHVSMLFRYPAGLTGYFSHSAFLGGDRNYFTIRGTEGLIHLTNEAVTLEGKRGSRESLELDVRSPHEEMWSALAEAARRGDAAPYALPDAARDLALLERVAESLHNDEEIELG